jgi:phospho-N-acetylmuramoyl-pentapeptide-transferase
MPIQIVVFICVFVMTIVLGPLFIPFLRKLKFGQTVREDGPSTHFKKMGTPTMGGIIFLIPILVAGVLYSRFDMRILPLVLVTCGFGLVGFVDDFIKVVKKRKDGLYPKQKMLGLIVIAGLFSVYATNSDIGTEIIIPFMGMENLFNLGWVYIPFTMFVLIGVTNSVNITDGLDGLAAGVTFFVAMFFAVVAMTTPDWEYVKIFAVSISAGCLGFLVFNIHPAKLFMGDTGSLALGGAIGAASVAMRLPLILIIVGGIYVIEAISVILQVGSFKLRGKRIFKMAPIHHHFELSGWKETNVVYMFWTVTICLGLISLGMLRINFF